MCRGCRCPRPVSFATKSAEAADVRCLCICMRVVRSWCSLFNVVSGHAFRSNRHCAARCLREIKGYFNWVSAIAKPVLSDTRHKSPAISYVLNPFFTTSSRSLYYLLTIFTTSITLQRCSYHNQLSIRETKCSESNRSCKPSSTIPLSPRKQLYNRYCSNKHTLCMHHSPHRHYLLFKVWAQ